MKGKRYTTEQKIRILREADQAGSTIVGVCQEHSISEQTFHRWKREFGMMELDQEMLYTLTEARVMIEDWRWKYNHLRPHGSLGYISPIEFEQKLEAEPSTQGKGSSRPPASFRPSLDLLYTLKRNINPSRLTV